MGNTMPYNLEAEQSILGCVMIDNEITAEVLSALTEADFYVESHKYIINAFKALYNAHQSIDFVTVSDELENRLKLEQAGGLSYLTDVVQSVPSAANYKFYFDIVKRDSTNRKLIRVANEIAEYARRGHNDKESLRFAEDKIYGVSQHRDTSDMESIAALLPVVHGEYQLRAENKKAFNGLMTGINGLDRLTNGLQKTNLIVLAARPGVGKTSLAMNIVEHAAIINDKICAVFSLEMSKPELLKRLWTSVAEVNQSKLNSGTADEKEWLRMVKALPLIEKSKIEVDDSSIITPAEMFSKCRRIKSKYGRLDFVMVDYIQLMRSGEKAENRVQEVAAITRDLKIMAKELDVPVLALSQLRRPDKSEKKEPQLSDLRESGAIEQDADLVMFINRPDMTATDEDIQKNKVESGIAYLRVAKNRHGGLDNIKLRFKGEITKFVNPEPYN